MCGPASVVHFSLNTIINIVRLD